MIPEPKEIRVCTICEQSWDEHLNRAARRTRQVFSDHKYDPYSKADLHIALKKASMSVVNDCVPLLKAANKGPQGEPGATGPMGMSGYCKQSEYHGDQREDFKRHRDEIENWKTR